MSSQPRGRALSPSEAGFLGLLLGANLVALASDVLTSALYPNLAGHLGVPLETVVLLTTPRALAQLGILALGPLSDRVGRAGVLSGGVLLIAVGAWGAALARSLAGMVAVQIAFGLGLAVAMAGVPALVGDRYPYAVRGQALGIVRLAMPLTLIAAVPGLVALAANRGVVASYVTLGTAATLLFLLTAWRLPRHAGRPVAEASTDPSAVKSWARPGVILLLGLSLAVSMVPTAIFGFLSAWVSGTFADPARNIGLALTGDGLGALAGAGLGALVIDRLTKRRAGILGLTLAGACALGLSAVQRSLGPGIVAIAGFSASLEVSLIALSALLSEAAPHARGTVMGLWAAALATGAALSPLVARLLWLRGGMGAIAGAGGAVLLVLAAVFALRVVEPGAGGEPRIGPAADPASSKRQCR